MQAARLLAGPTQSAAAPTTGTTAAAASADTDANGAIACTACVQQVQRGPRDVHGLLLARVLRPWQRRPAVPDLPCHAVLLQLI